MGTPEETSWAPAKRQPPRHRERKAASTSSSPTRSEQAEARLSEFWDEHTSSGQRLSRAALRRPARTVRAVTDVLALPLLEAVLSDSSAGLVLRQQLTRRTFRWSTLASSGACVLVVPEEQGEYRTGPRRQTLRRKIRAAEKRGVRTERIAAVDEQRALAAQLTAALRGKADPRYRQDLDHGFLVGQGPWTVAFGDDGTPLVIAVTPYDGEWALLQCFISLGDSPQHSDARYLLTDAVAERLREYGVRYLVDGRAPAELTNGLRHFQRMLGFRIHRVVVRAATAGPSAAGRAAQQGSAPAVSSALRSR